MKKRITLMTAVFALLAILALPMGMKGQTTVTFTAGEDTGETSVTKDGITVSMSTMSRTDNYRCYANSNMTVESTVGNITSVELTCTGSGNANYGPGKFSLTEDYTGSYSFSGYVGTWIGSAEEISLTASTQVRITEIVVTVGGSVPTSFTVTYDCNGGTSGCPEDLTDVEGESLIALADAPSKDGYDFAGWNDGSETYNPGDQYTVNGNVTFTAQWNEQVSGDEQWALTNLADLTADDIFVIVSTKEGTSFAMSNDKGASNAPTAVSVTISGQTITSAVTSNIKWTGITGNATDGYQIYSNADPEKYLYCTNNNNGLRVGTGNDNLFQLKDNYIYNIGQSRYIGVYSNTDWRSYTSINNNIAGQTFAFYKKVTGEVLPPSITANNVNIEYNATNGTIEYTINNEPTPAGALTASIVEGGTIANLAIGTITNNTVPFTCDANTTGIQRTATVTLTYTFNRETVTKDVTITQAAAPVVYTTIPDLFAAATGTATDVNVTFDSWVISAVKGSNAYLTDNQGHGLIIYSSEHGFQVNDVLTGTASCKLQLYRGSAELTELTTSTEGLTVANTGTVTEQSIAISNLGGVNTGSLLAFESLTFDGTNLADENGNTIKPYNTLYEGTFESGHTYNVKGIYVQYNTTKEILPRSADDIEEVVVPTEEYTLTISNPENITFTVNYGEEVLTNGETAEIANGTEITMTVNVSEGYVLESVTVVGENEQVVAVTVNNGVYTFYMPAYNATVNATAKEYVAPSGSDFVRISSLDQLTDGSIVVIASRYDATASNYFAMKNAIGNKIEGTAFESVTSGTNEVLSSTISDDIDNYYWVVGVTSEGYTFTNASGDMIGYGSSTNFATNGSNTLWTVTSGTSGAALVPSYEGFQITNVNTNNRCIALRNNDGSMGYGAYSTSNINGDTYNFFLDFFVQTEEIETETFTLEVPGYEAGSSGGYRLIASPVNVDPATVTGMILTGEEAQNYDLYSFDENEEQEWKNYKAQPFDLVPGKGYLYAKQATDLGQVFQFELTGTPYNNEPITLSYHEGGDFPGWNLVGNPFTEPAYIGNRDFYVMDSEGIEIIASENSEIAVGQGFFVITETNGEELDIRTEQFNTTGAKIIVNVSQNRGNVIDRAAIRVDNGRNMPKFMLNPNNTKLYIPQDGEQFAVVRSERAGRLPIVFKPSEDGEYSFSVNTENTTMWYLHLIDHETGQDIDLLRNPNYSFFAKTNNKPNRFELEYKTGLKQFMERPTMSKEESFGYYSNGEIIINGEGTLQVFDVNGRLIKNETINGDARVQVKAASGIYMMQLITNDSVKTQKVVVE